MYKLKALTVSWIHSGRPGSVLGTHEQTYQLTALLCHTLLIGMYCEVSSKVLMSIRLSRDSDSSFLSCSILETHLRYLYFNDTPAISMSPFACAPRWSILRTVVALLVSLLYADVITSMLQLKPIWVPTLRRYNLFVEHWNWFLTWALLISTWLDQYNGWNSNINCWDDTST